MNLDELQQQPGVMHYVGAYMRELNSALATNKALSMWSYERLNGQTRVTVGITDFDANGQEQTHTAYRIIPDREAENTAEVDFDMAVQGWALALADSAWQAVRTYRENEQGYIIR